MTFSRDYISPTFRHGSKYSHVTGLQRNGHPPLIQHVNTHTGCQQTDSLFTQGLGLLCDAYSCCLVTNTYSHTADERTVTARQAQREASDALVPSSCSRAVSFPSLHQLPRQVFCCLFVGFFFVCCFYPFYHLLYYLLYFSLFFYYLLCKLLFSLDLLASSLRLVLVFISIAFSASWFFSHLISFSISCFFLFSTPVTSC